MLRYATTVTVCFGVRMSEFCDHALCTIRRMGL